MRRMYFPGSGVTVPVLLPPAAAFVVSFFTSMVGISGAFLLLPFQISILSITAPSISATNLVFNLVATPGGLWRFARERRVDWRLGLLVGVGTVPGLLAGWWLRSHWLSDARDFELFVALVLAALALRLWIRRADNTAEPASPTPLPRSEWNSGIFAAAVAVGVVGGTYGIGGGSIMAPVLVGVFGLRVHAVAGATLLATLMTSIAGVAMYSLLPTSSGLDMHPDWKLGLLFGIGGLAGSYAGAQAQRFVRQRPLELGLASVITALSVAYIAQFLLAVGR